MCSLFGFFSLIFICDTFLAGEAVIIIISGLFSIMHTYDTSSIPLVVSGSGPLQIVLLCTFQCMYAFLSVYSQEQNFPFIFHIMFSFGRYSLVVNISKAVLLSYTLLTIYETFCCSISSPTVDILMLAHLMGWNSFLSFKELTSTYCCPLFLKKKYESMFLSIHKRNE